MIIPVLIPVLILSLLVIGNQADCRNPTAVAQTYASSDVVLSKWSVMVLVMELDCSETLSLHGLVGDNLMPVAKNIGSNIYQLSWAKEHSAAITGMRTINFYDDEGATSIRKSLRYGEEIEAMPLFSVEINNAGMKSELFVAPSLIALLLAVCIWWLAYTTKTKI